MRTHRLLKHLSARGFVEFCERYRWQLNKMYKNPLCVERSLYRKWYRQARFLVKTDHANVDFLSRADTLWGFITNKDNKVLQRMISNTAKIIEEKVGT